jgi:hypothetical protein
MLSPVVLPPVIASSFPTAKQIQSPVSGIPDLEFNLEWVSARHFRSSADFPQYNGRVNSDVVLGRFIPILASLWFTMPFELIRRSETFR